MEQTQKSDLEKSSDKIKKLRDQLTEVEKQIRDQNEEKENKIGHCGGLQNREQANTMRLIQCEQVLVDNKELDLAAFDSAMAKLSS